MSFGMWQWISSDMYPHLRFRKQNRATVHTCLWPYNLFPILHPPSILLWLKKKKWKMVKNVEAACFPASNSKPTCLESRQLTFGKLNTSSGCQSAKNKPEASSHGADYFRRRESMMENSTYLDMCTENASRRRQPPRVCFCLFLQLLSAPSRSGPLLLPPYNHGWGASTEWDPIIGAIVYNIQWHADMLWERGDGLESVGF